MAVRRRRKAATATNPRRRRAPVAANPRRRRNRTTIYAAAPRRTNRGRTANPRRRRRRNPQVGMLVKGAVLGAVGAMAQGVAAGLVPIHASGVMGLAIEGGVAYGVWLIAEKVVGGQNAMYIGLGAAAGFGKSVLNYVLGLAQSGVGALTSAGAPSLSPVPQMADITYYRDGMADIVPIPEYWPGYDQ